MQRVSVRYLTVVKCFIIRLRWRGLCVPFLLTIELNYSMKKIICAVGIVVCALLPWVQVQADEPSPVYELRVYTTHPGKMPDLLTRFKNHTCKLFERHGMVNVGYWQSLEQKEGDKLYYILKHESRSAAEASWKAFGADPEWIKVRATSEAKGAIVLGVESKFLTSTDFSAIK